ncbi:hypothetical protein K503DRAFT_852969 [Rhizopogon vinicolor AM-OR11-026]|uniref:Uncharacterized protein n=1 Tax=Rhizopogon vinicolor AM-OR11-026 TaxID=1314800 RepID=A0A1B7NGA8_9AGAM|nr:hypothetical protein K503DRAFT_852969 [Rhizopogon vinicolor AM-OR11-026]
MSLTTKQTCTVNTPTPSTPLTSNTTVPSVNNLSYIKNDLSNNPTSSHCSAISLTQCSSCSREETSPQQQDWLDLSFLGHPASQSDYFCSYWRRTVADEQDISLTSFMDTVDAHSASEGCNTRQSFSNAQTHWDCHDDWAWQQLGGSGWHHEENGAQLRLGHVMSKVPNLVQIGDDGHQGPENDIYVHAEGHAEHGVIWHPSHALKRQRNLRREQRPSTRPIVPHIASSSFGVDFPSTDPNFSNDAPASIPHPVSTPQHSVNRCSMERNHDPYPCPSSPTQTPLTPPSPVRSAARIGIPRCVSVPTYYHNPRTPSSMPCTASTIDRNRIYSHNPSRITIPAPLSPTQPLRSPASQDPCSVQPQVSEDPVVRNPRYRRLLKFICLNTERKIAEIEQLIRSMRPGTHA